MEMLYRTSRGCCRTTVLSPLKCKIHVTKKEIVYWLTPKLTSKSNLAMKSNALLLITPAAGSSSTYFIASWYAFGKRVNYSKSSVYFSPNLTPSKANEVMNTMKIKNMEAGALYLGLPTVWGRGKKAALGFLKEKISSRIYSWRGRFLSQAGKEVLIKAVVSAMPVYIMQVFKIPKTFCVELNVLLNRFWWGKNDGNDKGVHWLAWDKMSTQKKVGGVGFRDFQAFNISLLAKQAWRLIHEPDSLWAKLLKAIYFPYTEATNAKKTKKGSWGWTSIYEGIQFLNKDLRWNVGDGKSISIWDEKWVPSKKDYKVKGARSWESELYNVSQLIDQQTSRWDETLIRSVFDKEDSDAIISIPTSGTGLNDKLVWHRNKNGIYNAKEGYHVWMENYGLKGGAGPSFEVGTKAMNWNSIWSLETPPKIKDIIWRGCHDVLPTCGNLARRKHSRTTGCGRCGEQFETTEHALFFCPMSIAIWRASEFSYTPSPFGFSSFAKWWIAVVEMSKEKNSKLNLNLLSCLIWEIWKCRNRMIYEHSKEDPIRIWLNTISNYDEYLKAINDEKERRKIDRQKNGQVTEANSATAVNVTHTWIPPDRGKVAVNCDAAYDKHACKAGLAVVIRDHEGRILDGFNERTVASSAFAAECLALRLGFALAVKNRWNIADIRSDCKSAVDSINGLVNTPWEVEAIIKDIQTYTSYIEIVSTNFVRRNENRLADWVARHTLKGNCPVGWMQVQPHNLVMNNFA